MCEQCTKNGIQKFPQEVSGGAWPLLAPTRHDRQYRPIPETADQQQQRLALAKQAVSTHWQRSTPVRSKRELITEGLIIGLASFSLIYWVVPKLTFLLQGWHWAFLLGGIILCRLLLGNNRTSRLLVLLLLGGGLYEVVFAPFPCAAFLLATTFMRYLLDIVY